MCAFLFCSATKPTMRREVADGPDLVTLARLAWHGAAVASATPCEYYVTRTSHRLSGANGLVCAFDAERVAD
jgi:hypothetical protein